MGGHSREYQNELKRMKEWNIENDGWLIFEERNEKWNEELTIFEGMNYWKKLIPELIPNSFFFDGWKEWIIFFVKL